MFSQAFSYLKHMYRFQSLLTTCFSSKVLSVLTIALIAHSSILAIVFANQLLTCPVVVVNVTTQELPLPSRTYVHHSLLPLASQCLFCTVHKHPQAMGLVGNSFCSISLAQFILFNVTRTSTLCLSYPSVEFTIHTMNPFSPYLIKKVQLSKSTTQLYMNAIHAYNELAEG